MISTLTHEGALAVLKLFGKAIVGQRRRKFDRWILHPATESTPLPSPYKSAGKSVEIMNSK